MARKITNTTFTINIPSTYLEDGDDVIFKFRMESNNIPSIIESRNTRRGELNVIVTSSPEGNPENI